MQILISRSESTPTHPNFKQILYCQVVHQFCPNSLISHESGKANPPPHLILPLYSVLLILLACFSIFLIPEEWSCKILPPFQEEELHWGGISNGGNRIKYSRVLLKQNWQFLSSTGMQMWQAGGWTSFPSLSQVRWNFVNILELLLLYKNKKNILA